MKKLLKTTLLLILIITSCKQKEKPKVEKMNKVTEIKTDTIKTLEVVKTKIKKDIPDYNTIKKQAVTRSDYIHFLNDVLKSDGLVINERIEIFPMESEYWNSDLIRLTEKSKDSSISELIDENDIKFIYEQTKSEFRLNPNKIKNKKIEKSLLAKIEKEHESLENYWNEIYKYGSGYYSLELPLFSINKKIAFFRYSFSCGSLCANTGTYIYKKVNGKWKWIGSIGIEIVS